MSIVGGKKNTLCLSDKLQTSSGPLGFKDHADLCDCVCQKNVCCTNFNGSNLKENYFNYSIYPKHVTLILYVSRYNKSHSNQAQNFQLTHELQHLWTYLFVKVLKKLLYYILSHDLIWLLQKNIYRLKFEPTFLVF